MSIDKVIQSIQANKMPSRQIRMILAWIEIHRDELLADWELCQNGEKPFKIEPLGQMFLSSSIKDEGYEVNLALTSENLEKKVREYKPNFIGYSIMTGDQDFYNNRTHHVYNYR